MTPIPLPGGRTLLALRHAATYITSLPEWQAAVEALMLVATRGGPTMFVRIGVMQALNRGHVREFDPKQKSPHWGKRKLKRDE